MTTHQQLPHKLQQQIQILLNLNQFLEAKILYEKWRDHKNESFKDTASKA